KMLKKTNKLPKSELELEFEVSAEKFNSFFKKALKELSQNLEIKGFRKGNVPQEIAEEKIEKQSILSKAAEIAAQEEYNQYLLESKIEPVSYPELTVLKLAENNDFIFKIKVALLPDLILPDYRNIAKKIEKKLSQVEEKEIEQTLNWLQKTRAQKTLKQKPAEKGDFVEIEYSSSQTGKQQDAFLLGEGKLVFGFEEAIVGLEAGQEKKDVRIVVPENHPSKEIAGKEIFFNIKVSNVFTIEIPELNDEFAKSVGKFQKLQELKDNIKEGIQQEKQQAEREKRRAEILNQISEKTNVDIPPVLIEREHRILIANLKEQVQQKMNLSFEDYLKQIKKTENEIKDSLLIEAGKRVKQLLVLKEIAKKEKIQASDQEIEIEAEKILKRYKNAQEAQSDIDPKQLRVYTKEAIINEKVLELLENI
ncbi:MAG: trigger factor, partial [Candidatus Pacebacteria bacterium]|nr:trigger factor [Candidatus Paceibacterota bacterium]